MERITLRHCTPAKNLRSIFASGIQHTLAHGKMKVVWLHQPRKTRWALAHVAARHSTAIKQLATIEVQMPRADVRRNRDGIYICARTVRPDEITAVNSLRICLASVG
jgi:Mg2+ and Co2+ transporter CorA